MTVDEDGHTFTCQAGRLADFGGKWLLPCSVAYSKNQHHLVSGVHELVFCEDHMLELIDAGLITEPFISREGAQHLAQEDLRAQRPSRPLFGPWIES